MVDLMSHVFFPPRDIREKWVGHVDFQLPSKRQKPSGKPQSSNKGLKLVMREKIAQPFASFLSFGLHFEQYNSKDAKTGLPVCKIPFSKTQQTKWFGTNLHFWLRFCKPFLYWRSNQTEVRYSSDTVVEKQQKKSHFKSSITF